MLEVIDQLRGQEVAGLAGGGVLSSNRPSGVSPHTLALLVSNTQSGWGRANEEQMTRRTSSWFRFRPIIGKVDDAQCIRCSIEFAIEQACGLIPTPWGGGFRDDS